MYICDLVCRKEGIEIIYGVPLPILIWEAQVFRHNDTDDCKFNLSEVFFSVVFLNEANINPIETVAVLGTANSTSSVMYEVTRTKHQVQPVYSEPTVVTRSCGILNPARQK
jgi:hypothetical protein